MSNGLGEDKAAAAIAVRLMIGYVDADVVAAPLVTDGECYSGSQIPLLTRGRLPPSGGFPMKSLKGFFLDLGCAPHYVGYVRELASRRREMDRVVVVGDVALLCLAAASLRKPIVFIDLAKSSCKGRHYLIEEAIMRRIGCSVLARDEATMLDLAGKRIEAAYLGNPMMDGLGIIKVGLGEDPVVGLLPGSRREIGANLARILQVIELLPPEIPSFCALSSGVQTERIADAVRMQGWGYDGRSLWKDGRSVRMIPDGFAEVVSHARVVIGLAGSANEQAAGLGIPVISFVGCGPQTTERRMRDQERLMGGSIKFVRDHPEGVAAEVMHLLGDSTERARRGAIGMWRMGPPGASEAIARFLAGEFGLESVRAIAA